MRRSVRRAATLALAALGVVAVHGCTERLEGGSACPVLCPNQEVELREAMIEAVLVDSTLAGYPAIGEEQQLLLTSRGDTLDTRIVVRYDTLPSTYLPSGATTRVPIDFVEGAELRARLQIPAEGSPERTQSVTIEAYDVDTTVAGDGAADTAVATMLPLFRQDRFLGSVTFTPQDIANRTDPADSTVRVPIDNAYLLGKIQAKARLRVGLLVRSAQSAQLLIQGSAMGRPVEIRFDASPGEAVTEGVARPYSATPAEPFLSAPLSDFVIVARRRAPDTPPQVIAVGGVPGKRTYLRFDLPPAIVDSTSVVRATLFLTQYPNRLAFRGADSVAVYPSPLGATERVTDLAKAATLLFALRPRFELDSLRVVPNDSGEVAIEVAGALAVWRIYPPEEATRALVLRTPTEGIGQDEVYFFSTEAAAALRPRLRIVYAPRVGFGLP